MKEDLMKIVGERITTDHFERWFYASDLLSLPGWVRNLFQTIPDAVVKPKTAQEVKAILSYCSANKIPAVPRGAGSSGLFGAVPKKGGIVLDLRGLSEVIEVNKEEERVVVEAGITWQELDKRLREEGLTLKSYPSSARSATVGGWIMSTGLGIGSLKYGSVFDQVLSAEVVLPNGLIKEYARGKGLEVFFESEGMLGVLSKVCLKIRPLPELTSHHLIYFNEIERLFQFVGSLAKATPPPYALEIFDHKYLALLKVSGYRVPSFNSKGGALLITYEGAEEEVREGERVVKDLLATYPGEEKEGAEEEWKQRFNMLRIKRAVPSLIPSCVHIPLDNLSQFYSGLEKLKKRPIALLGHVVSSKEAMLMPMIVSEERKTLEYTFALHTPWEVSNLALSLGGKPGGGLGVWNAPYLRKILSRERRENIRRTKKEVDRGNILNPGMWLDPPFLFKPKIYQIAMSIASKLDRVFPVRIEEPGEKNLKNEFFNCVQCGYCMNYCPTRQEWLSSTPRGRILATKYLFFPYPQRNKELPPNYLNSIFQCTLCGRCGIDCSVEIKSPQIWIDLRSQLISQGFELESLKALTASLKESYNIASRPNEQRANWARRLKLRNKLERREGAKVVYFVGCITSFYPMVQDIARSFIQILDLAGIDFSILGGEEWCCGYPLLSAGHREEAGRFIKHNVDKVKEIGAECVVVTCPGCYRMWKDEYQNIIGQKPPFDVFHSTEFLARLIEQGKIKFKGLEKEVTYHDPCDLGRNSGIYDEPRYIISKIPGIKFVELKDNREYCNCCGSGGDLLITNQALSLEIAGRKVKEILDTKTQSLITACPSCIRAISMAKTAEKAQFDILDITQLVWRALVK